MARRQGPSRQQRDAELSSKFFDDVQRIHQTHAEADRAARVSALLAGAVREISQSGANCARTAHGTALLRLAREAPDALRNEACIDAVAELFHGNDAQVPQQVRAARGALAAEVLGRVLAGAQQKLPGRLLRLLEEDTFGHRSWLSQPESRAFVSEVKRSLLAAVNFYHFQQARDGTAGGAARRPPAEAGAGTGAGKGGAAAEGDAKGGGESDASSSGDEEVLESGHQTLQLHERIARSDLDALEASVLRRAEALMAADAPEAQHRRGLVGVGDLIMLPAVRSYAARSMARWRLYKGCEKLARSLLVLLVRSAPMNAQHSWPRVLQALQANELRRRPPNREEKDILKLLLNESGASEDLALLVTQVPVLILDAVRGLVARAMQAPSQKPAFTNNAPRSAQGLAKEFQVFVTCLLRNIRRRASGAALQDTVAGCISFSIGAALAEALYFGTINGAPAPDVALRSSSSRADRERFMILKRRQVDAANMGRFFSPLGATPSAAAAVGVAKTMLREAQAFLDVAQLFRGVLKLQNTTSALSGKELQYLRPLEANFKAHNADYDGAAPDPSGDLKAHLQALCHLCRQLMAQRLVMLQNVVRAELSRLQKQMRSRERQDGKARPGAAGASGGGGAGEAQQGGEWSLCDMGTAVRSAAEIEWEVRAVLVLELRVCRDMAMRAVLQSLAPQLRMTLSSEECERCLQSTVSSLLFLGEVDASVPEGERKVLASLKKMATITDATCMAVLQTFAPREGLDRLEALVTAVLRGVKEREASVAGAGLDGVLIGRTLRRFGIERGPGAAVHPEIQIQQPKKLMNRLIDMMALPRERVPGAAQRFIAEVSAEYGREHPDLAPENNPYPSSEELIDKELFWKGSLTVVLLSAYCPATMGRLLWNKIPTVKSMMQMSVCGSFTFPPPGYALSVDFDSEQELWKEKVTKRFRHFGKAKKAAASPIVMSPVDVSKRGRKRKAFNKNAFMDEQAPRKKEAAAGEDAETRKVKGDAARWNQLKDRVMFLFPESGARRPPEAILRAFHRYDAEFGIGNRLRRCTNPDFIRAAVTKQGSSSSSGAAPAAEDAPLDRSSIEENLAWLVPALSSEPQLTLQRMPVSALVHLYLVAQLHATRNGELSAHLDALMAPLEDRLRPFFDPSGAAEAPDAASLARLLDSILGELSADSAPRRAAARRSLEALVVGGGGAPPAEPGADLAWLGRVCAAADGKVRGSVLRSVAIGLANAMRCESDARVLGVYVERIHGLTVGGDEGAAERFGLCVRAVLDFLGRNAGVASDLLLKNRKALEICSAFAADCLRKGLSGDGAAAAETMRAVIVVLGAEGAAMTDGGGAILRALQGAEALPRVRALPVDALRKLAKARNEAVAAFVAEHAADAAIAGLLQASRVGDGVLLRLLQRLERMGVDRMRRLLGGRSRQVYWLLKSRVPAHFQATETFKALHADRLPPAPRAPQAAPQRARKRDRDAAAGAEGGGAFFSDGAEALRAPVDERLLAAPAEGPAGPPAGAPEAAAFEDLLERADVRACDALARLREESSGGEVRLPEALSRLGGAGRDRCDRGLELLWHLSRRSAARGAPEAWRRKRLRLYDGMGLAEERRALPGGAALAAADAAALVELLCGATFRSEAFLFGLRMLVEARQDGLDLLKVLLPMLRAGGRAPAWTRRVQWLLLRVYTLYPADAEALAVADRQTMQQLLAANLGVALGDEDPPQHLGDPLALFFPAAAEAELLAALAAADAGFAARVERAPVIFMRALPMIKELLEDDLASAPPVLCAAAKGAGRRVYVRARFLCYSPPLWTLFAEGLCGLTPDLARAPRCADALDDLLLMAASVVRMRKGTAFGEADAAFAKALFAAALYLAGHGFVVPRPVTALMEHAGERKKRARRT